MDIRRLRTLEKALIPKPLHSIAFVSDITGIAEVDGKEYTIAEYEKAQKDGLFIIDVEFVGFDELKD